MKQKKNIVSIVLCILIATLLGGCGASESANVYRNETWKYTVEIPESWEGKYQVLENGNISTFVQITTYEKYGDGTGCLFSIQCLEGKKTQEEVDATVDGAFAIPVIMQTQEYTYAYVLPTDVQYPIWDDADEEDALIVEEYEDMASDIDEIIASIKVID